MKQKVNLCDLGDLYGVHSCTCLFYTILRISLSHCTYEPWSSDSD